MGTQVGLLCCDRSTPMAGEAAQRHGSEVVHVHKFAGRVLVAKQDLEKPHDIDPFEARVSDTPVVQVVAVHVDRCRVCHICFLQM